MNELYGIEVENPEGTLSTQMAITEEDVAKAAGILQEYKSAKSALEQRIVEDELWYEMQHWSAIRKKPKNAEAILHPENPKSTSAWLFNAIMNKHADIMDNYPEPIVLPREPSDVASADLLSEVLPVVMEYNEFNSTYNDASWEKLKHGTGVYGIFWNSEKENGLGDIDIREIDLLKIFWEPGITDIQKSRNLFIVDLVDNDILEEQYPQLRGKSMGQVIDVATYVFDDYVDTSDKSLLIDWYYKTKNMEGKTVTHYVRFCGDQLLYASQNDPIYREVGWYAHGMYPVEFDVLFPEKGTPIGFGYVAICKDPQIYIDQLSSNILKSSLMNTRKRFFISESTAINEEEFNDWNKEIVHVAGELGDEKIREIVGNDISPVYLNVITMKIDEMKETAGNRDVNSGGSGSGVTAASAIAALQEAGNKSSRDMIGRSYTTFKDICIQVIELMRQFYTEQRTFRIVMPGGDMEFRSLSNEILTDQPNGIDMAGNTLYRKPIFDLKIKAQKQNPFSRMEENQRAMELYQSGFFDPANAQAALNALEMMSFEGIDEVKKRIAEGQTLYNMVQMLAQRVAMLEGQPMMPETPAPQTENGPSDITAPQNIPGDEMMESAVPRSSYTQRLVNRTKVEPPAE